MTVKHIQHTLIIRSFNLLALICYELFWTFRILFCLLISVTVVNFIVLHHHLSRLEHSHAVW